MRTWTINRQILLWMLIVSIIPILLLSSFYLYHYDKNFKNQELEYLGHIADNKTERINEYIGERIRDAQLAAQLPSTNEALKVLIPAFKQRLVNESNYQHLQKHYSLNLQRFLEMGYHDIFLISPNADIVLTLAHEDDRYTNLSDGIYRDTYLTRAVKNAFSLSEPSLSYFAYYAPSKELTAFIAVPVLEQGNILGVIAFQLDMKILQAVVQEKTGLGATGESNLATVHNQRPLFISNIDEKISPALLQSKSTPFSFGKSMTQALTGNGGRNITIDRKGNKVLAIHRYLPFLHAGLVVKIDSDEALNELNIFWKISLSVVFFILSVVIVIAYFLSRSIAKPIIALTQLSSEIAQGKQKHIIQRHGSKEILTLSDSFNAMSEEVAIEKAKLEQRVKQRTLQLSQKEQYLALTLNSIGDGVISTDTQGRVMRMNPVAEHLTGWDFKDAQGKSIQQIFNIVDSTTQKAMINPIEKVLSTGETVHLSNHTLLTSKQGKKHHIADTAAPIKDENQAILGMVLIFNDVTETYHLRESEQALAKNIRVSEQHLRLYREQSPIASIEWNIHCEVVYWNQAAEKLFGYHLEEVKGRNFFDFILPETAKPSVKKLWNQLISQTKTVPHINENLTKDGRLINCEWHNTPLTNKAGEIVGIASLAIDITDRLRVDAVLQTLAESGGHADKETIFQLIVRQLALSQKVRYALIAYVNPEKMEMAETQAVWANGKFIDNFSYSLKGTPCENVTQNGACLYPNDIQNLFPEDPLLVDMAVVSYFGVPLCASTTGKAMGIVALLDDKPMHIQTSSKKLLESLAVRASIELERQHADEKLYLAARIFDETHEGITITDANANIIDVNPAFCKITGYSREEILGKNPRFLNSGKQTKSFYKKMWATLNKKGYWQGEVWNRKKNGVLYAQRMNVSTLLDEDGNITHYMGLFSDITVAKQQQKSLELLAHYDVLTNLPNRTLFADRFAQAIAHSKRANSLLAVCFIDLDEFKPVNDTYGHEVGDKVLIEVAQRVKASIREQDTVSRLGGDEFTLLLGDMDSIEQCHLAIHRIQQAIAKPYLIEGKSIKIAASSGMTIYPLDDADPDTLIRHADSAMYTAKMLGRNRYHLFDASHEQQLKQHQSKLKEIEIGFANDEMCLYYQPKVNMKTGVVYGVEALIRWIHPEKGIIPPLDFLPFIADTELEITIGNWVMEEAWAQLASWRETGLDLEMSVNVSAFHLEWEGFFNQLNDLLAKHTHIPAKFLQLEILESSVLADLNQINQIIKQCRQALGVKVALDDFGTGYSSLTHLRRIAVDTIKIDQSFVRDMLEDPNDYALVKGVIALAHAFQRDVIAEGVETNAHGVALMEIGCIHAQGYGISRPIPAEKFIAWINLYQFDIN